jgi:alkylation response protein AidB-like acyl-CoA dehydrogenase
VFDAVRVGADSVVGELYQGWPIVEQMLDRKTALLYAQITGAKRKAANTAVDRANAAVIGRTRI